MEAILMKHLLDILFFIPAVAVVAITACQAFDEHFGRKKSAPFPGMDRPTAKIHASQFPPVVLPVAVLPSLELIALAETSVLKSLVPIAGTIAKPLAEIAKPLAEIAKQPAFLALATTEQTERFRQALAELIAASQAMLDATPQPASLPAA